MSEPSDMMKEEGGSGGENIREAIEETIVGAPTLQESWEIFEKWARDNPAEATLAMAFVRGAACAYEMMLMAAKEEGE